MCLWPIDTVGVVTECVVPSDEDDNAGDLGNHGRRDRVAEVVGRGRGGGGEEVGRDEGGVGRVSVGERGDRVVRLENGAGALVGGAEAVVTAFPGLGRRGERADGRIGAAPPRGVEGVDEGVGAFAGAEGEAIGAVRGQSAGFRCKGRGLRWRSGGYAVPDEGGGSVCGMPAAVRRCPSSRR